jgi:hypothetical protein
MCFILPTQPYSLTVAHTSVPLLSPQPEVYSTYLERVVPPLSLPLLHQARRRAALRRLELHGASDKSDTETDSDPQPRPHPLTESSAAAASVGAVAAAGKTGSAINVRAVAEVSLCFCCMQAPAAACSHAHLWYAIALSSPPHHSYRPIQAGQASVKFGKILHPPPHHGAWRGRRRSSRYQSTLMSANYIISIPHFISSKPTIC